MFVRTIALAMRKRCRWWPKVFPVGPPEVQANLTTPGGRVLGWLFPAEIGCNVIIETDASPVRDF
jgi:hypothetical protein